MLGGGGGGTVYLWATAGLPRAQETQRYQDINQESHGFELKRKKERITKTKRYRRWEVGERRGKW